MTLSNRFIEIFLSPTVHVIRLGLGNSSLVNSLNITVDTSESKHVFEITGSFDHKMGDVWPNTPKHSEENVNI